MHKTSILKKHELRVEFLQALAELAGYPLPLKALPGGFIPDVLQLDTQNVGLFIGDAKNTETPFNQRTQVRLFHYLCSFANYLKKPGSHGVFAVCFGRSGQGESWQQAISMLTIEAGIQNAVVRTDSFGQDHLIWYFHRHLTP